MSLYERVYEYQNLKEAYKQTQAGPRKYKKDAVYFAMAKEKKLTELWRELKNETYVPGPYLEFYVYEPKERLIHAPRIRDKIVQFATHTVLQERYRPIFIKDSYACIKGRGTHDAVRRIQHFMRLADWKYEDPYILKLDIRKYFYSIDREILKQLYRKKIPAGEKAFLTLLDRIVDSSPEGERGLPLGNVTSQDFANIYLNELDQYCKRFLGIKHYVRYMDDVTMIFSSKEEAREALNCVKEYVEEHLHLQLNEKTKLFPLRQGVNTLGFKIHTTHRKVRDSSKRAMKRRIRKMNEKRMQGKMEEKEIQQAVNSWLGHARHSNSYFLCKKIFKPYPYIRIEDLKWKFGERRP